jgi:hypothetical protein
MIHALLISLDTRLFECRIKELQLGKPLDQITYYTANMESTVQGGELDILMLTPNWFGDQMDFIVGTMWAKMKEVFGEAAFNSIQKETVIEKWRAEFIRKNPFFSKGRIGISADEVEHYTVSETPNKRLKLEFKLKRGATITLIEFKHT